jgi:phage shock protein B
MADVLVPLVAILGVFVGLPAVILHYITKMRQLRSLSDDDERTLDDLNGLANRLDDRLRSIERILDVDHPNWRRGN